MIVKTVVGYTINMFYKWTWQSVIPIDLNRTILLFQKRDLFILTKTIKTSSKSDKQYSGYAQYSGLQPHGGGLLKWNSSHNVGPPYHE